MTEALAWKQFSRRQDSRSREFLLAHYDYLAVVTVRRSRQVGISTEDLLGYARIGLVMALDSYDPTRWTQFSSWAICKIRGQIQEAIRENDSLSRREREHKYRIEAAQIALEAETGNCPYDAEVAAYLGMPTCKVQGVLAMPDKFVSLSSLENEAEGHLTAEDFKQESVTTQRSSILGDPALILDAQADMERFVLAIERLRPRTAEMVRQYYFDGLIRREIADIHQVSESRVSQLLEQGLARMKLVLSGLPVSDLSPSGKPVKVKPVKIKPIKAVPAPKGKRGGLRGEWTPERQKKLCELPWTPERRQKMAEAQIKRWAVRRAVQTAPPGSPPENAEGLPEREPHLPT